MKNLICPKCQSTHIALIFYGYPVDIDEYLKGIESGLYAPGGCCVDENSPRWICNDCKFEFGARFHTLEEFSSEKGIYKSNDKKSR